MIRQQPGPQKRGRVPQRLQQFLRGFQGLRSQQASGPFGKHGIQPAGADYQNRTGSARLPQAVAAVPESRQLHGFLSGAYPYGKERSLRAVLRRRTENHRQDHIRRRGRHQQNIRVHVGVEYAVDHWNAAPGQETQPQHTACHSAGYREKKQQKTQEAFLAAVGDQPQQNTRRQLDRHFRQKPAAGEKNRRRICAARQSGENIASPAQRQARQARRRQQQQVIHHGIQDKYAVKIDHRHGHPPFPTSIIGQARRKIGRKRAAVSEISAPHVQSLSLGRMRFPCGILLQSKSETSDAAFRGSPDGFNPSQWASVPVISSGVRFCN